MRESQELEFVCSYMGECEYLWKRDRRTYRVRYFAHNPPSAAWNDGVFEGEIKPLCGCVYGGYGLRGLPPAHIGEFPAAELVALFPGFIAARYVMDKQGSDEWIGHVEYLAGQKPDVVADPIDAANGGICCRSHYNEFWAKTDAA